MELNIFKRKSLPMAFLSLVLILVSLCIVSFLIAEFIVHFCSRTGSGVIFSLSPSRK